MNRTSKVTIGLATVWVGVLGAGHVGAGRFHGESARRAGVRGVQGIREWLTISLSRSEKVVAVILGNPEMIAAYRLAYPPTASPSRTAPRWRRSTGDPNRTSSSPCDRAGRAGERRLHGQGQQEVRGQADGDMPCSTTTWRPIRHPRHHGWHTAARERRQVRVRVSHEGEGKRLHLHGTGKR